MVVAASVFWPLKTCSNPDAIDLDTCHEESRQFFHGQGLPRQICSRFPYKYHSVKFWIFLNPMLRCFFSGKLKIATASCPVACLHDALGRALSNLRSSRRNRRRLWDIWTCQQLKGSWLEFHSSQVFHELVLCYFIVLVYLAHSSMAVKINDHAASAFIAD